MHNHEQQKQPFQEMRDNINLLIGICQILSKPLEVWWRKAGSVGGRYYGFQALVGWLVIPFWSVLFPTEDARPLLWFWGMTTGLFFVNRMVWLWMHHRDLRHVFSLYVGDSRLAWLFGDRAAKRFWEPVLSIGLGVCLFWISRPVGSFVVWSGIALAVSMNWSHMAQASQIRQMRDSRVESEFYMGHFREEE